MIGYEVIVGSSNKPYSYTILYLGYQSFKEDKYHIICSVSNSCRAQNAELHAMLHEKFNAVRAHTHTLY